MIAVVAMSMVGCGGDQDRPAAAEHVVPTIPAPSGPNSIESTTTAPPVGTAAGSPRAAVEGYLDAEIAGNRAASLALLSADDRTSIGDLASWEDQHDTLPQYVSYVVASTAGSNVVTDVVMEPHVDETSGIVPGRARIEWATTASGGGFTVDLAGTAVTPSFPPDAAAGPAALGWVTAMQSGEVAHQYEGTLLGQPGLRDDLPKTRGTFRVGSVSRLTGWQFAQTFTDALGPDSAKALRVVRLEGPGPIEVVTAPLGDDWVVVGAVAAA